MESRDFNKQYKTGVVESIDDPTFAGRIKVRIKGLHDNITTDNLPWCTYGGAAFFSGKDGGSISIPRVGTNVRVRFKDDDINSMEWYGTNRIDRDLADFIKDDYPGTQVLLWDKESDLYIIYQNRMGLKTYYKESYILIAPDNTITIHYGIETSGVQIQLSDGKVDIQSNSQINISSENAVNVEAKNIVINGTESVQIKGEDPGECAVNGVQLMNLLSILASAIDLKMPSTAGVMQNTVNGMKETILNRKIQYI